MDTKVINEANKFLNLTSLSSHTPSNESTGSKSALLKDLETEHQCKTIRTCKAGIKDGKTKWEPVLDSDVLRLVDNLGHNQSNDPLLEHITVLQLNVWFSEHNKHHRFNRITEVIEQVVPDFVCLQEVQPDLKARLQLSSVISNTYYISDSDIEAGGANSRQLHGVLILSKWPCQFMAYPFPSSTQGRSLLTCQTVLNGQPFVIATSHLESRPKPEVRTAQITQSMNILDTHQNVLMTGDFNFGPGDIEQQSVLPNFIDTYIINSYKEIPAWTWTRGPLENKGRANSFNRPRQRLDRILMKSDNMRNRSFDLIGRHSIAPYTGEDPMLVETDGQVRTISDHFGLLAVFQFKREDDLL